MSAPLVQAACGQPQALAHALGEPFAALVRMRGEPQPAATDGRLRWADTLDSEIRHPPMVLNGQIVVAQTVGDVVSYR